MAEEILNAQTQEQELSEILQVRRDKLKALQDEGRDPFNNTKFERTAYSADVKDNFETMENQTVSMCGRIMAKRGMGKAIFADIADDKEEFPFHCPKVQDNRSVSDCKRPCCTVYFPLMHRN